MLGKGTGYVLLTMANAPSVGIVVQPCGVNRGEEQTAKGRRA